MKKFFTIVLAILMMASALCIHAFAAEEPSSDIVLRVSGLKKDGVKIETVNNYTDFESGWNAAMDLANSSSEMNKKEFIRVVVDLYADWTAVGGGFTDDFLSGPGFFWDTIYINDDARITLNLNGHTINRDLKGSQLNGEVIYIDDDADVIINNGTITGGWSSNGAGGIHINDGAKVTLNDVNVINNKVNGDNGAGIALYDGAVLTMNGGSVSNNVSYNNVRGGGVFIDDSSAYFKGVTFENNQGNKRSTHGSAVYVNKSTLSMENCTITGNGLALDENYEDIRVAYSIIDISVGSEATIKDTKFLNNGYAQETYVGDNTLKYTTVINVIAGRLTMERCAFSGNNQAYLIQSEAAILKVTNSDFTQNNSFAFFGNCAGGYDSAFTNCKFSYSQPLERLNDTFYFNISKTNLSFIDCEFGNSTFNNKSAAKFVDTDTPDGSNYPASIFGEGSLTMIVAILALVVSVVSICITVAYNKKKTVSVVVNNTAEAKDEE